MTDNIPYKQKLDEEQKKLVEKAYKHLEIFTKGCKTYHDNAKLCRKIYHLADPEEDRYTNKMNEKSLQMTTLRSTLDNCVADQMDNMPEALMLPERADLQHKAEDLTDITRHILSVNDWEDIHRQRVEDFLITGTAVTQIVWDSDMDNGRGDVAVFRYPIESLIWDSQAENIQDARAVIKVSWHPKSWFEQHYVDYAKYIEYEDEAKDVGVSDSKQDNLISDDESKAMLMEYWYRLYDARKRKHTINVAYIAGRALLDEAKEVYGHGMYPFVLDVYARIEGEPVGFGLIDMMRDTMRGINRNAKYLDINSRYSSKNRLLISRDSNIDLEALADWENPIVEGENIRLDGIKWLENKPLNSITINELARLQTDLKQDSGQNNFARGESGGGITAASAISALQEAGNKTTRYKTNVLNTGFRKIVTQIMWVMREYYTNKDTLLITGRAGDYIEISMNSNNIFGGKNSETPPYAVQIQIQRRNPLRIQAQNELVMQAYSMSAQSGQYFPLTLLFELMQVDGKDRIMPALEKVDQTMQMLKEAEEKSQQADVAIEENGKLQEAIAQMQEKLTAQDEMIRSGLLDTVPDEVPQLGY